VPESRRYGFVPNIVYREGRDLTDYMRERCRLDVYHPEGARGFPTVVFFHGGSMTSQDRFVPERFKGQGLAVVAATYRLSPKVKAPAYIEDAAAAVAWAFQHIIEYGGSARRIFVGGISAGAYLAGMVGLDRRWLAIHGVDANEIAGLILLSGQMTTHAAVKDERGQDGRRPIIDELAPLFHVREDAPPMLLVTGDRELELLARYDENAYLQRMMRLYGHTGTELHELPGCDHGTMAEPSYEFALRFVKRVSGERR
jgi:acetyl esterase/lipase